MIRIIFLQNVKDMWFCYCWTTFDHVQQLYKSNYVCSYLETMEYLPNSQKRWPKNNQQLQTSIILTNLSENIWKINFQLFIWTWCRKQATINGIQLLYIVHNLYQDFDAYPNLKTRRVFGFVLDLCQSLAHGLIFKLKSALVSDSLSKVIENFLRNRFQRFLLNGQESERTPVKTSVSQVFILVSLFF